MNLLNSVYDLLRIDSRDAYIELTVVLATSASAAIGLGSLVSQFRSLSGMIVKVWSVMVLAERKLLFSGVYSKLALVGC